MAEVMIDKERYFVNRLAQNSDRNKLGGIQSFREMKEYAEIWMEILQEQLQFDRCKKGKFCFLNPSIYTGSAGLALLDWQLSKNFDMDSKDREQLLARAYCNLECSLQKMKGCRMTFLGGDAGPLALAIVMYSDQVASGCPTEREVGIYLEKLLAFHKTATSPCPTVPNQVLCGRAGYLWALLFVNKHYPALIDPDLITEVVVALVRAGKPCMYMLLIKTRRDYLMYRWRGKEYLGAAHGLFGILYVLLKARAYWPQDEYLKSDLEFVQEDLAEEEILERIKYNHCPNYMKLCNERVDFWVLSTLKFLTTQIFNSGNTLPTLGAGQDKLVNWAHGAPGAVYTFIEAHKLYGEKNFLTAAVNCGEAIWKRGLLKNGYSLADGVSGNAYALMALYKYTHTEMFRRQAIMMAEYCYNYGAMDDPCRKTPDHPLSLYEGLAGVIYMLYDFTTCNPKLPAYEL